MIDPNIKKHFSKFFAQKKRSLHFAAHSHHPWPDRVIEMHGQYALDTSYLLDEKWSYFFSSTLPAAQGFLAEMIGDTHESQIVFAANTHEFIVRLLSCLPLDKATGRKLRILSSDHEFYSLKRQMLRLEEDGLIEWKRVPIAGPTDFYAELEKSAVDWQPDMVFCSHVTFDRGLFLKELPQVMQKIRAQLPSESIVVIDGYHALGAVPTGVGPRDLDGLFYLGGAYKYLAAGEGGCFLRVPRKCKHRPRNTGWFADFGSLDSGMSSPVGYADNAWRFAGATMDYSAVYRLVGTKMLWSELGLDHVGLKEVQDHISYLQDQLLGGIKAKSLLSSGLLKGAELLSPSRDNRGSFLCFGPVDLNSVLPALLEKGVVADGRESVLRIGFGIYQDKQDVDELLQLLS